MTIAITATAKIQIDCNSEIKVLCFSAHIIFTSFRILENNVTLHSTIHTTVLEENKEPIYNSQLCFHSYYKNHPSCIVFHLYYMATSNFKLIPSSYFL